MKKKFLFSIVAFVMGFLVMSNVFAAEKMEVNTITSTGSVGEEVNGVTTVTFGATTLKIDPAQAASDHVEERPAGSGWLGIKVTAPDTVNDEATYYAINTLGKKSDIKKFSEFKDAAGGKDISLWSGVNFEVLNAAIVAGKDVTMEYHFDWNADGDYEQIVKVVIDPEQVTLQTKEGDTAYPITGTLGEITSILPESASVTGSKDNFVEIVYPNVFELEWVEKDQDGIHRPQDGWWIGIRVSKAGDTSKAKFKYRVNGGNFSDIYTYDTEKDEGQDYVSIWALINEEKIEGVDEVVYEYYFDWDGDGEYEQIVTQRIPVKNITLKKDGETIYPKEEVKDEPIVEVETPNTYDGISLYLLLGGLSLICLTAIIFVLKSKKSMN